jgi:predicted nucleic acid-binding protein
MDRVVIDTSAWIESFRPKGNKAIRDTVERLLKDAVILMPGIIRAELLRGTKNQKEFKRLSDLLGGLEYLPVNDSFWEKVAQFSFDLFRKGVTVPLTDTYIALLTIEAKAKILHNDTHFDLISSRCPLSILGDEGIDPCEK